MNRENVKRSGWEHGVLKKTEAGVRVTIWWLAAKALLWKFLHFGIFDFIASRFDHPDGSGAWGG